MAFIQLKGFRELSGRDIRLEDGTVITPFSGAMVRGKDGDVYLFDSLELAAIAATGGSTNITGPREGVQFVRNGENSAAVVDS